MKRSTMILLPVLLLALSIRCTDDVPECPNQLCLISGVWRLTTVYYDNEEIFGNFARYQLTLTMPDPTSSNTSNFARVQISGTSDSGTWTVENNGTLLRLVPNNDAILTEDWLIENSSPRALELVMNRDTGIKDGPATIRLLLEPEFN